MGTIFGIVHESEAVEPRDLTAMDQAMQHRLCDRSWIWSDGKAGLGSRLLDLAPEARRERPPSSTSDGDTMIIACDARLDDVEEIIAKFSLTPNPICDSEVILSLYKLFGKDCVDHLLGAFAFAIYDPAKGSLFCARDHFGEKPFCYALAGSALIFASEPTGVVAPDLMTMQPNKARIYALLALNPQDHCATIYEGVLRLPAGHTLSWDADGLNVDEYWQPRLPEELTTWSDAAIAARFRELLEIAVARRIRTDKSVGATLSGGLDSSAIVMLARKALAIHYPGKQLFSFSAVFPSVPDADEQQWIEIVEQASGSDLAPLECQQRRMDELSPLMHAADLVRCLDEPIIAPNLFHIYDLAKEAREKGVGIILGGHDGDTVVSHGLAILAEIALAEDWPRFSSELQALGDFLGGYEGARIALVKQYAMPAVPYLLAKGKIFQAARIAWVLRSRYGIPASWIARACIPDWLMALKGRYAAGPSAGANPLLTRAVQQDEDYQRISARRPDNWRPTVGLDHLRQVAFPLIAESFEFFDRIGAATGVEHRHPFFDKELVEFCLSLPANSKIRDGWTRFVLRDAMRGVLPEAIRLRKDKSNLGHNLAVSLLKDREKLLKYFAQPSESFENYWDKGEVADAIERYFDSPSSKDAMLIQLAFSHKLWLERGW